MRFCALTQKTHKQKNPYKPTKTKPTTNYYCKFLIVPCLSCQNPNLQQSYSGVGEKKFQFLSLFWLSLTSGCHHQYLPRPIEPCCPCVSSQGAAGQGQVPPPSGRFCFFPLGQCHAFLTPRC